MDENDSLDESDETMESNNVTNNETNGCNQSDNKLTQYMLINKELSKTLVVLRAENARLRNHNKELNRENLAYCNELTSNRTEVMKWRRKFTKLQAMHIQHVETLTTELQSYADKLTGVFVNDDENGEAEVTSRDTEQNLTVANSPSICDDDREVVSARVSKSTSSRPDIKIPEVVNDNPSALNTIREEESDDDTETSLSEQISLVTSSHESTTVDETATRIEMVGDQDTVNTIIARMSSASDSCEMASMDSNKENERPSTFLRSQLTVTNEDIQSTDEDSTLIDRTNVIQVQIVQKSVTPLKEKFVTQRRAVKRKTETNSFEETKSPDLVSSTPIKRKRGATYSPANSKSTTPIQLNDSARMTRRSTMSSGRPRRNACPINFIEPKLNTKMRRPRT